MAFALLCATLIWVGTTPAADDSGDLTCWPRKLYRGDTLVVELPKRHEGFDFAIMGPQLTERVISFKPSEPMR